MRRAIPLFAVLLLAACGRSENDVDRLDRDLVAAAGNDADPALTSALEDQIMVDPALSSQADAHSLRPATPPLQAQVPAGVMPGGDAPPAADRPTLGQMAARQGRARAQPSDCYATLDYSHSWATRLPAGVPLPRDAAVEDAAGNDLPGCRTRVLSYATAAPPARVIAFHFAAATRAGFAAERGVRGGEAIVAGDKPDGSAFFVSAVPRGSGSEVSVVVNDGR